MKFAEYKKEFLKNKKNRKAYGQAKMLSRKVDVGKRAVVAKNKKT